MARRVGRVGRAESGGRVADSGGGAVRGGAARAVTRGTTMIGAVRRRATHCPCRRAPMAAVGRRVMRRGVRMAAAGAAAVAVPGAAMATTTTSMARARGRVGVVTSVLPTVVHTPSSAPHRACWRRPEPLPLLPPPTEAAVARPRQRCQRVSGARRAGGDGSSAGCSAGWAPSGWGPALSRRSCSSRRLGALLPQGCARRAGRWRVGRVRRTQGCCRVG